MAFERGIKAIAEIISEFAVTSAGVTKTIGGRACMVENMTGTTWIKPGATATTASGSYQMTGRMNIPIRVPVDSSNTSGTLAFIATTANSTVQILIWAD